MTPEISKIKFFFPFDDFSFHSRTKVKRFLLVLIKTERKKLIHLNYIFSSDKLVLQLNKKYLNHNYKTDILTFPLSEIDINAEIYISVERIKENSKRFATSFRQEFLRVMIHGILHLCGYNDSNKAQTKKMRAREDFYLDLFKSFT
jgi:rRNA maturation RNase YbeY